MERLDSVEYLQKKLNITTKIKEIEDKLKNSKCPICGSQLSYEVFPPQQHRDCAYAELKCYNCGMLNKIITWNSVKSYHWISDGTSYLDILNDLYKSVEYYLK